VNGDLVEKMVLTEIEHMLMMILYEMVVVVVVVEKNLFYDYSSLMTVVV
jgi:hypothetical protein